DPRRQKFARQNELWGRYLPARAAPLGAWPELDTWHAIALHTDGGFRTHSASRHFLKRSEIDARSGGAGRRVPAIAPPVRSERRFVRAPGGTVARLFRNAAVVADATRKTRRCSCWGRDSGSARGVRAMFSELSTRRVDGTQAGGQRLCKGRRSVSNSGLRS